jgi:hypothetical protein
MNPIINWIFAMMLAQSPPERDAKHQQFGPWVETPQEREARYRSIAEDVWAVAYDPDVKPVYAGPNGRAHTASLLLAVTYMESGWAPDVDKGPCYRGKKGGAQWSRCDGGRSACMAQINIGTGRTLEGWTQKDLFDDRRKCLTVATRLLRGSVNACKALGPDAALNLYGQGYCGKAVLDKGKARIVLARKFSAKRPDVPDAKVPTPPEPSQAELPREKLSRLD